MRDICVIFKVLVDLECSRWKCFRRFLLPLSALSVIRNENTFRTIEHSCTISVLETSKQGSLTQLSFSVRVADMEGDIGFDLIITQFFTCRYLLIGTQQHLPPF